MNQKKEQVRLDRKLFIGGYGYNAIGEKVEYEPVLELELAHKLAKRNHIRCNGKGVLKFDNGVRENVRNEDGLSVGVNIRYQTWYMACDCVKTKLISLGYISA